MSLVIRHSGDIMKYCMRKGIDIEEFNEPVVIAEGVTDCSKLFEYCSSLISRL